ncbi:uncharacterized protein CEXT_195461 [Caerostris extrusa]|uniref:Gustatory receptor n=1 Tax=Caerostris extrusa TaxID=172846 RepID=A0AAV4UYU6_CAEEX|nr:uncharacterized protein CEXT_195461 [Caerostris extrusa]
MLRLLRTLARLHHQLIGPTQPSNKFMNYFLVLFVMFMFEPGVNNLYDTIKKDSVLPTCFHIYIPLPSKVAKIWTYFFIQMNHQFINWSLSYLVSIIIIFCCMELNKLIKTLAKRVEKGINKELIDIYEELFDTIRITEDSLKTSNGIDDQCQHLCCHHCNSLLTMILIADDVQKNFMNFQRLLVKKLSMYRKSQFASIVRERVFSLMVSFFNSCNRLRPTETHKKKLLLYTIESLVTYGALLQQLQQTDGIFVTVSGFSNCNRLFQALWDLQSLMEPCFNSFNRLMASLVTYRVLLQQLKLLKQGPEAGPFLLN